MTKKITVGKFGFISIEQFADFVDITKAVSYKFKLTQNGVQLAFYDKNGKKLPVKTQPKQKLSIDK